MTHRDVSFTISKSDSAIIRKIVDRAVEELGFEDRMTLTMDITAAHANGNPLRLTKFLLADAFNFAHDIYGISNCMNRETGQFDKHFSPRFSKSIPAGAKS